VQWQSQYGCVWGLQKHGHIPQHSGPTANYVKYWGMENGLPISDPGSGFDPADPWVNRDPRFYKTIVVDGDQITNATSAGPDQYAQLHTGGRHRDETASATGFITNKYWGLTCNKFDNGWSGSKFQFNIPLLRLSDVYLMYAEAVLQGYGSPQSSSAGSISALEAVNRVRNRANVPDVHSKFTDNKESFMEQIILERAVELSFEAHRWYDLRRWLKNGDSKYLDKTELLFDRDPDTQKPINLQERLIVRRVVTETQNWLPFPIDVASIYQDFQQNPGW
jgi:starch-binding outer membrane protein, SusD/RagB family